MTNGFVKGITTGAIVGAAIGLMIVPQLDRGTRKKLKRSGNKVINMAEDVWGNMMKMSR